MRVLVTGATGFVGKRLCPVLVERGVEVRAMTRKPDTYDGPGEPVRGDVHDADSLAAALEGCDVAVYLVHSLDDRDFERKDAEAATTFGTVAAAAGVQQIVYLGGLGDDGEDLSAHLRSRREVEHKLAEGGVPVTVLRAAIVVGAGGISWEITRQLVKNLPAMVVPKWVSTRTQPVAVDDVIRYLDGVIGHEGAIGKTLEIGGPEQLTYLDMMQQAAQEMLGRKVPIVTVPLLSPGLSSHWISFVTDVEVTTAKNLIDSMSTEVVVRDHTILDLVPGETIPYREAVRRALAESAEQQPA
ncbi:NAD(P)H-binding protein [Nocardioides litoris]|uniref:NAD(P)H-binding protein n=1 Tax=Nocardioides litoris TaxID=1926648 RepID=UPI001123906D|nr:NAD(P)H-binding protein [Nocardioides litoris]